MDVSQARAETNTIVTDLVAGLTPEHREMQTPCKKWNVHELLNHMVMGGQMISAALTQDMASMPDMEADLLADGPAAAWKEVVAAMTAAETPQNLEEPRPLPFGEMPGSVGLSIITADHLTHAWDLARATGLPAEASDELCEWASSAFAMVLTDEMRDGDRFDAEQPCPDGAPPFDKLAAFTGRAVS